VVAVASAGAAQTARAAADTDSGLGAQTGQDRRYPPGMKPWIKLADIKGPPQDGRQLARSDCG
jgi:hypothetical protein